MDEKGLNLDMEGALGFENEGRPASSGIVPRLYRQAFQILAVQIGGGVVSVGARLTESSVAAQFGISRAPARQALAELAREGFVEKMDGRGYRVRSVTPAPGTVPIEIDDDVRLVSLASWERIYAEVEGEIAARISFASWRVNEAELARHHDVSRTVARDVVGRLQQRGLIRKDDRARWYAPALTPDHIGELYELRWILEPVALEKAAANVPRALLAEFRGRIEDAVANARSIGGPVLDRLEEDMHHTLLGYCRNKALMQAISQPQSLLIAHRFLYRWTRRLFETEPFLPEHLEIVNRLEAGAVAEAASGLEHHLKVSRDRAIARIDSIVETFRPDELPYLERIGAA
ncbi:MAG: GntR family transcriptional regulator [Rhizobiaceae bacterium]